MRDYFDDFSEDMRKRFREFASSPNLPRSGALKPALFMLNNKERELALSHPTKNGVVLQSVGLWNV
jgi:hypothetical protein